KGPTWLFDLDYLTDSMNYHPVSSENHANLHAGQQEANQNTGTGEIIDAGNSNKEDESAQDCFVLPIWPSYSSPNSPALTTDDKREGPREEEQVFMDELERLKKQEKEAYEEAEALRKKFETLVIKEGAAKPSISTASPYEGLSLSDPTNPEEDDSEIPPLEDIYQNSTDGIFTTSSYDDEGAVADFTNLETVVNVSPIPTLRIHSTHPKALILGDPNSAVQTRSKVNTSSGKISEALEDESWVDAMQEELLQFEIQKVWVLVDLPYGKKAIGTKWVYQNKKDERGVVVRNKARLVAQGHRQEEGIDYDESVLVLGFRSLQVFTILSAVKRIFSDYAGGNLDGNPQRRLSISWQETNFLACKSRPLWLLLLQKQSSTMAVLDSCPKHNMVAYLEKSEGNAEFHEIIDFLKGMFYVIMLSLHIIAKVAGKFVSISEASIRSDLLFDDADGIDTLPNQAIFDVIQFMGTFWDQIPTNIATAVVCLTSNQKYNFSKLIFDDKQLANVSVPLDHFPVNTLTSKVFSFMIKKGKHFSRKVTPLFATMLVQTTQAEGASSDRPSEAQPTPSPAPTSEVPNEPQTDSSPAQTSEVPIEQQTDQSPRPSPTPIIPDSVPETSGENLGGHSSSDKSLSGNEDQAKEIQLLKAQITKLKKQAKPIIRHHRVWLKSVSLKQRFLSKSFSKKHRVHKESVSKQGRKVAKGESSVQRDPLFDTIPEDSVDHIETENA
ncbi:putative ribonuclease H-like domain-containing protein, partial [Tanacetum coccineum]